MSLQETTRRNFNPKSVGLCRLMLIYFIFFRMFVSSVKRLRIMRTSEANGLGMRFRMN